MHQPISFIFGQFHAASAGGYHRNNVQSTRKWFQFLEFIELNNTGIAAVDLTGYTFSAGVVYTFPSFTLNPGQFVMIAIDSVQFETNFGRPAFEWTSGSLNNGGELIQLSDAMGNVVDEVDYDDSGDWPTSPDGGGPSLVLCDFSADNNLGSNWQASPTSVGVVIMNSNYLLTLD